VDHSSRFGASSNYVVQASVNNAQMATMFNSGVGLYILFL